MPYYGEDSMGKIEQNRQNEKNVFKPGFCKCPFGWICKATVIQLYSYTANDR